MRQTPELKLALKLTENQQDHNLTGRRDQTEQMIGQMKTDANPLMYTQWQAQDTQVAQGGGDKAG